jgi:RNA polymerase sigma-54 factor
MTKITQKLDFRQQQALVMTPQMQQAVKLLQMSNLELQDYLEEEIEQNPLLEKAEGGSPALESGEEEAPSSLPEKDNIAESFDQSWSDEGPSTASPPSSHDFDSGSMMADIGAGGRTDFSDDETSFENTLGQPTTLRDHLQNQLMMDMEDPRDRMLGTLLIDRLDEAGYLRESLTDIAEQLSCPLERLQALVSRLYKNLIPQEFSRQILLNVCLCNSKTVES